MWRKEPGLIESHEYHVQLAGTGAKTGLLASTGDRLPAMPVASPPEFGGPGGLWSPEHLFVAAVSSCLMTTFKSIADMSDLEVLEYSDDAIGHLQRGDDRLYRIDKVTLRPKVVIADESKIEKAERLLEKAEKVCLVSRSIASEVEMDAKVLVGHQVGT